jgi:hypothetical protein
VPSVSPLTAGAECIRENVARRHLPFLRGKKESGGLFIPKAKRNGSPSSLFLPPDRRLVSQRDLFRRSGGQPGPSQFFYAFWCAPRGPIRTLRGARHRWRGFHDSSVQSPRCEAFEETLARAPGSPRVVWGSRS